MAWTTRSRSSPVIPSGRVTVAGPAAVSTVTVWPLSDRSVRGRRFRARRLRRCSASSQNPASQNSDAGSRIDDQAGELLGRTSRHTFDYPVQRPKTLSPAS
jgi:hypothetical protein